MSEPAGAAAGEPTWDVQLKEHTQSLDRVRAGLEGWMRTALGDRGAAIVELAAPKGTGVANETVIFSLQRSDGAVEGYVARLATPTSLYLVNDLSMHYRMYEAMMAFPSVPTPAVIGYEADPEVVGAAFFVMDQIDGEIPTDQPSYASSGFVAEATPEQRRRMWEGTVQLLATVHDLPAEPFSFLRTGASSTGTGDGLDYWVRSLRWAAPAEPIPLIDECEAWLMANQPAVTALSWGDSRLPNVIYRDFTPVGLLDWDLVSLMGPEADLAWWMLMEPGEAGQLPGMGSHRELVERWEQLSGRRATRLRWHLAFGAYRLAAIFARLFPMLGLPPEFVRQQLATGQHVGLIAGLLDLTPPLGVIPIVPDVPLEG